MENYYNEEKKIKLAVEKKYDVIVVGGGPSGIAAALAATRHRAKVLVIEKKEQVGGLASSGLIAYFPPLDDGNGFKTTRGIVEEMFYLSIEHGYNSLLPFWSRGNNYVSNLEESLNSKLRRWDNGCPGRCNTIFNAHSFALATEDILLREGVEIMYDTVVCDTIMEEDVCKGVIVENLNGRSYYTAKVFIDCSGYGTLFLRAGAEMVSGVNFVTANVYETSLKMMQKAVESGDITKGMYWYGFGFNPAKQKEGTKQYFANTQEDINKYILDWHKLMFEHLKEKRKTDPDYMYAAIPSMNSIRKSRQIVGKDSMMPEHVNSRREDSVGVVSDWLHRGAVYEIPYGSLFDAKIKNILAAGRVMAAHDEVWDVMRVYSGGMCSGQAAGTAAAISASNDISPDNLDVSELQNTLEKDNVLIHYKE